MNTDARDATSGATNADKNDFLKKLPSPTAKLLSDPFGKSTRRYQLGLVISSVISLLLARGIVTLNQVSVAGLKLEASKTSELVILSGMFCLYFFVQFVVACVDDLSLRRIARLPSLLEQAELANDLEEEHFRRLREYDDLWQRWHQLYMRRTELAKELNSLSETLGSKGLPK